MGTVNTEEFEEEYEGLLDRFKIMLAKTEIKEKLKLDLIDNISKYKKNESEHIFYKNFIKEKFSISKELLKELKTYTKEYKENITDKNREIEFCSKIPQIKEFLGKKFKRINKKLDSLVTNWRLEVPNNKTLATNSLKQDFFDELKEGYKERVEKEQFFLKQELKRKESCKEPNYVVRLEKNYLRI